MFIDGQLFWCISDVVRSARNIRNICAVFPHIEIYRWWSARTEPRRHGQMKQKKFELFGCEPDRLNILYVEWDTTACIYSVYLLARSLARFEPFHSESWHWKWLINIYTTTCTCFCEHLSVYVCAYAYLKSSIHRVNMFMQMHFDSKHRFKSHT